MPDNEHTRGPWRLAGGYVFAEASALAGETATPLRIGSVRLDPRVPAGQRRANARAMAAAPDLIAALEVVRALLSELAVEAGDDELWNEGGQGRVAAGLVRAALAKAGR